MRIKSEQSLRICLQRDIQFHRDAQSEFLASSLEKGKEVFRVVGHALQELFSYVRRTVPFGEGVEPRERHHVALFKVDVAGEKLEVRQEIALPFGFSDLFVRIACLSEHLFATEEGVRINVIDVLDVPTKALSGEKNVEKRERSTLALLKVEKLVDLLTCKLERTAVLADRTM